MSTNINTEDWEVTSEGLYVARREFLIRRGYCCANQCRNCPYINWRNRPEWHPIPAESVQRRKVAPKSVMAATTLLQHHERQLEQCAPAERDHHRQMVQHYTHLLKKWSIYGRGAEGI